MLIRSPSVFFSTVDFTAATRPFSFTCPLEPSEVNGFGGAALSSLSLYLSSITEASFSPKIASGRRLDSFFGVEASTVDFPPSVINVIESELYEGVVVGSPIIMNGTNVGSVGNVGNGGSVGIGIVGIVGSGSNSLLTSWKAVSRCGTSFIGTIGLRPSTSIGLNGLKMVGEGVANGGAVVES